MSDDDEDEDEESDEDERKATVGGGGNWTQLAEKAMSQFKGKKQTRVNWAKLVYAVEGTLKFRV